MKMNVDLGVKQSERYGLSAPCCPCDEKDEIVYPRFSYTGKKDLGLAKEGVMKIRFRKTRSAEEEKDGKESYECDVEVLEILEADGEMHEKPEKTESVLDGLMKMMMDKHNGNSDSEEENTHESY